MSWPRDLVVFGFVLTVLLVLAVTVLTSGFVPGCQDNAPMSPATAIEISYEDTTLRVTIAEGHIPVDGTRHLDAVVSPGGTWENRTSYRLLGPDEGAEHGDSLTVENATVAGRELQEGDVVRVIWYGYDLDPRPAYCPGDEERSVLRTTLGKFVVGEDDADT
jgi:hypothetical protein